MLCRELLRGEVAEARMWPFAIVGDAPALDFTAGVVERQEDVLVEALLPQPGIETFNVGVLDRFARRNELELHPMLVSPLIEGSTAEFRPVCRPESHWGVCARGSAAPTLG